MPKQTFLDKYCKKRLVIIDAENVKNYMALQDSIFPFGH
jgi:hypothetical protein